VPRRQAYTNPSGQSEQPLRDLTALSLAPTDSYKSQQESVLELQKALRQQQIERGNEFMPLEHYIQPLFRIERVPFSRDSDSEADEEMESGS
jgi:hypothetical protein